MKKLLLLSLALMLGGAVIAQHVNLKSGLRSTKYKVHQTVGVEPVQPGSAASVMPRPSGNHNTDVPGIANVITIGKSANGYGYGYGGGQKTMVWADDTLKVIANLHRLGPGSTPPSYSGYLGIDYAGNMGQETTDWKNDWQIYAATLNTGGSYYLDAARYPQGGIFSPYGNTSLDNAYFTYFAPNLSNDANWGGYSYGRTNLVSQADSTKHMYWYTPGPYTYIPAAFTITQPGVVLAGDIEQEWNGSTLVGYKDNLLLDRGVWNSTTKDFEYEMNAAISCPTTESQRPLDHRIAASPDGQTIWMVVISNNGDAQQIGTAATFYPIVLKSIDAGLTWSDPIAIQLDGPSGISGIVDGLYSDYRIQQLFTEPYPERYEIGYTTSWDCDIVVDKWGNPHIGVVVSIPGEDDYSFVYGTPGDSVMGVYDIYSTDGGISWQGARMGIAQTWKGQYGSTDDLREFNRVNMAVNEAGDKVFVTWNDTQIEGITENSNPDVFARGFDLVTNKITDNKSTGGDEADNVSYLSDVYQQAWFECTSHYVFTDDNKCIIPIVTEFLSDPSSIEGSVIFKYISDFSYTAPDDYTIPTGNPELPTGISNKEQSSVFVNVFPNPVKETANLSLSLSKAGDVKAEVTNTLGQVVLTRDLGRVSAGSHQFALDAGNLKSGIYFCSVIINGQKNTTKMVVE